MSFSRSFVLQKKMTVKGKKKNQAFITKKRVQGKKIELCLHSPLKKIRAVKTLWNLEVKRKRISSGEFGIVLYFEIDMCAPGPVFILRTLI